MSRKYQGKNNLKEKSGLWQTRFLKFRLLAESGALYEAPVKILDSSHFLRFFQLPL